MQNIAQITKSNRKEQKKSLRSTSNRSAQKLVTGYRFFAKFKTKNCFIQAKLTQLVSKKARGQ